MTALFHKFDNTDLQLDKDNNDDENHCLLMEFLRRSFDWLFEIRMSMDTNDFLMKIIVVEVYRRK